MSMQAIIGDYRTYFGQQKQRLLAIGIDITGYALSHLGYRTETYEEYLDIRDCIEEHCTSNIENVWNGRPMSIMQLKEPLDVGDGFKMPVIELIPPVHQRRYKMGMEHFGVVIGDGVDEFSRIHRAVLTGQQFQSMECQPYYVTFVENYSMVKFYQMSLLDLCKIQHSQNFIGFSHVENWQPDPQLQVPKIVGTNG